MSNIIEDFWPVNIRESRYDGVYSGGRFVLTAGYYFPANSEAFGADPTCMAFWSSFEDANSHGANGPVGGVRTVTENGTEKDVVFVSGDDPTELLERAKNIAADYRGKNE